MSDRWIEVAWHPDGFVLSDCTDKLRAPWVGLRLAHPDWAHRRKRDRYVWLTWNATRRQLSEASQSPTTAQFPVERPDVLDWVKQVQLARARG